MKRAMKPFCPDIAERGRPATRVFTTKQGLPQNTIQAMTLDLPGYLWIGIQDGAGFVPSALASKG